MVIKKDDKLPYKIEDRRPELDKDGNPIPPPPPSNIYYNPESVPPELPPTPGRVKDKRRRKWVDDLYEDKAFYKFSIHFTILVILSIGMILYLPNAYDSSDEISPYILIPFLVFSIPLAGIISNNKAKYAMPTFLWYGTLIGVSVWYKNTSASISLFVILLIITITINNE